jgi:isoquinoline 1-oxidoreductase beta subunit
MTTQTSSVDGQQDNTAQGATRRQFLVRAAAGGGFMVGCTLPGIGGLGEAFAQTAPAAYNVTAWIVVGADESITIQVPITEMGQGTMTGLAQIVADELRVAWSRIKVVHAPVDAAHGGANASPWGRFTGGSLGIRLFSPNLQQAAANARQMLIQAAAQTWGVSASACTANLGTVTATTSAGAKSLTYGALAPTAATVALTSNTPLNLYPRTLVGTSPPRVDIPAKVNGSAQFGIDVFLPGMVFAAVKHCPTIGGTVGAVGSKPAGALAVVQVGAVGASGAIGYRPPNGVAVVAATTWDAMRAAKSLGVNWNLPADAASNDTNAITARANWLMSNGSPIVAQDVNSGYIAAGLGSPNTAIAATYQLPFLAHAALEPLNCTVRYTPSSSTAPARCEVWAPTQAPDGVMQTAKGLCPANTIVTVVNTLVGAGFGRKFEQDFIREAVQVALAYPGKPVKLTWPREEDFGYDQFRPMAMSSIQASTSPAGKITAWRNRVVTPSISVQRGGNPNALDGSAVDGAIDLPYALNPVLVEYVRHDTTIPVGYWRSVGMSINTFAVESAMDELAAAIGWDPIQFRLNNLSDTRMTNVLTKLKALANWGTPAGSGRAQGVAIAAGFGSYVGQVVEISVNATSGAVTVHRISAVIDCGLAVNPDAIKAQIEGAVAQAVSATLYAQQTFVNGVPQVRNYSQYRLLRLRDMPQVDVQIIANGDATGGVGEPGVPCVAPAIANAHARLLGQAARKRALPFFPGSAGGGL